MDTGWTLSLTQKVPESLDFYSLPDNNRHCHLRAAYITEKMTGHWNQSNSYRAAKLAAP